MSRATPWGAAQHITQHARGIATVQTAGHGGLMISRGVAEKYLSEAARKAALIYGGYFCYEEDCDFEIPLFDSKEVRDLVTSGNKFWSEKSEDEIKEYLINSLSVFYPNYLLEIGVQPAEEPYKRWKLRKKAAKARANNDPKLVTCCWGDYSTLLNGVIKVSTADGKFHYVSKESYDATFSDKLNSIYLSLDSLVVIDMHGLPSMEDRLIQYAQELSIPYLEQIKSKPDRAVKELQGKCYGPRSKFNGSLKTATETLHSFFVEEKGLSLAEANQMINEQLDKIHAVIDDEFKTCQIFGRHSLAA